LRADSSYCGQDVALFKKLGELLWPNPKVPRSSLSSLILATLVKAPNSAGRANTDPHTTVACLTKKGCDD
jgi:hypothetical protein